MISVPTLCAEDREIKPQSGQTKEYKIDICCFFTN